VNIEESKIPLLIKQGKDRDVVPVLYKKVFPVVRKYIVSHGGLKEDAFDVFQDALADFYKQVMKGEFNEQYKVYGFLFRFSVNKWINKVKRNQKVVFKEDMTDFDRAEEYPQSDYVLLGKDENLLQNLFAPIGAKCIELLNYTVFSQMVMEDIAVRMGFPSVAAVKMQQQRCKQKLIQEIERNPSLMDKLRTRQ
jgi:RNA polymerase sigma factor (sigma-70 family)